MPDQILALLVVPLIGLTITVLSVRASRVKNQHEWHRDPRYWRTNMRRKLPDGSFVYRKETEQEGKDDQEMGAW